MTISGRRADLVLLDDEPVDPVRLADALRGVATVLDRLSEGFGAMAEALMRAEEQRRARREWLEQHARAVQGHDDAVLYLLRTPRP